MFENHCSVTVSESLSWWRMCSLCGWKWIFKYNSG